MDMFYSKTKGFSLLELIIVISLISILAVYTSAKWTAGPGINISGQAEQFMSDLRYTQTLAMTRGVRACLVGSSGNSYQIYLSNVATPLPFVNASPTVTLINGIAFGAITPTSQMIVFDSKGQPYYNGATNVCNVANANAATPMTTTQTIQLVGGGQSKTVTIAPLTGSVSNQ